MKICQDLKYQVIIQCKMDQDHLDQEMKMKSEELTTEW